jgi:hypothetical protein
MWKSRTQRAKREFCSLKKSQKNGGGQNITPLFWGTFGAKNACFGRVWSSLVEFLRRRLISAFNWTTLFPLFSHFTNT